MEIKKLGVKYTLSGMAFSDTEGNCRVIQLPDENVMEVTEILKPDMDGWDEIMHQLDVMEVEGIRHEQKVILRKSQRNIEAKISWMVYRRDNYTCRYCGAKDVPLTVDHILTWESGGASKPENLVASCKKCNNKRGNMPYEEWIESEYYTRVSRSLTEDVKKLNLELVDKLDTLPRLMVKRRR